MCSRPCLPNDHSTAAHLISYQMNPAGSLAQRRLAWHNHAKTKRKGRSVNNTMFYAMEFSKSETAKKQSDRCRWEWRFCFFSMDHKRKLPFIQILLRLFLHSSLAESRQMAAAYIIYSSRKGTAETYLPSSISGPLCSLLLYPLHLVFLSFSPVAASR